jgi:hypothetical protein
MTTAEPRPHKPPDPRRKPPHPPENSTADSTTAKPVNGQKTENEKQSMKIEEAKRTQLSTEKRKKNESKRTRRPKYTWGSSQNENDEVQGEPKRKHKEKWNTEKPEQEGGRTTKNAGENARSKSTSERRR